MRLRASQDFGGSLFLYVAMMVGGLALFVLPIYWLNAAEVHTNPGIAAYQPPRGTNVIPPKTPEADSLATLARAPLLDPALQAAAAENIRKLNGGRTPVAQRAPAETTGSAVPSEARNAFASEAPRPARPTAMQMLSRRMSTAF